MIRIEIINQSSARLPRQFLTWASDFIFAELVKKVSKQRLAQIKQSEELTLVFLDVKPAKRLNAEFRGKDYATDVLSFESIQPMSLGELVMCPQVLKKQALDHGLSFRYEVGYMLIHGILHLLGYEHEKSDRQAKQMFALQDAIFEKLCSKWEAR